MHVFRSGDERNIDSVPRFVLAGLIILILIELTWAVFRMPPKAHKEQLGNPPPVSYMRLSSLGDDIFLSRVLALWLQSFDYQPGISLSYKELDYDRLVSWLNTILKLDPRYQYPLLLATRIYGEVNDASKQRKIIEYARHAFIDRPNSRWRWMAHAVYLAKYRLGDLDLALDLARELANHVTSDTVPFWARQMHIYTLEDMGELRAAKILLGGLLESGEVKDPKEVYFLKKRLEELEKKIQEGSREN